MNRKGTLTGLASKGLDEDLVGKQTLLSVFYKERGRHILKNEPCKQLVVMEWPG
jgi:hypothetical protein